MMHRLVNFPYNCQALRDELWENIEKSGKEEIIGEIEVQAENASGDGAFGCLLPAAFKLATNR